MANKEDPMVIMLRKRGVPEEKIPETLQLIESKMHARAVMTPLDMLCPGSRVNRDENIRYTTHKDN